MASEEWGILNNPNALIEPGHDLFVWLLDRLCPCRLNRSPLAGFGVEGVVAGSLAAGAFYGRAIKAVFFRSSVDWSNLGVGSRCR
jgi:hypothetical protein